MQKVLMYPANILRNKTQPVQEKDRESIQTLSSSMLASLSPLKALGLAANQIGVDLQMFVMKTQTKEPLVLINPEIILRKNRIKTIKEGCLSIPSIVRRLNRSKMITVSYLDSNLSPQERKFSGIDAVVIQHEIDHLNGVSILDYLTMADRQLELVKLQKWKVLNKYVN